MSVDYINYGEYLFCMNRIAYWLINNNKTFNTRQVYGYFGRDADYATIIKAIQDRGSKVELDSLIAEFVECAIVDNKDKSFLPNYVTCSDAKTRINKEDYINMANYVSSYEVTQGKSPDKIFLKKTPEPTKLYPYITTPGGGKLGQTNGYRCGPHSLMQCIYRLTGIELSESTLASVCGTTSSGTSHQGLETGLAWFNKKYGYNLKMTWKNKSDLTWDEIQQAINNGALFFHLLYKFQWGHYEVIKSVGDTLTILNSLGSYCNYPAYCGYIENRSKSTQQSYINGISQKSVCIITRG